jgi:adenylylsulfate kinase
MKSKKKNIPGWAIWFVGLPGAGKSTYAQAVYKALQKTGDNVQYLCMDECRKSYFTEPKYTQNERTKAYKLFAKETAQIVKKGTNVIMDGTAPKLFMREYARKLVERFAEIFVRCPLEIAMYREANRPKGLVMVDLYQKALKRKETGIYTEGLGEVVGVDIPFEENPTAECVIESDRMSVNEGRDRVLAFLKNWQAIRILNRN